MTNKLITMTAFIALIQLATIMNAQERVSILAHRVDTVILREGNVDYLRTAGISSTAIHTIIERVDTKHLKIKSYENLAWGTTRDYGIVINNLLRSVFSKERAKQLENISIFCRMHISPVENKITHIDFHILGSEDENFPLKLSEVHELDKRMREEPKALPPFKGSGKIVDHGEYWTIPIRFKRLYE